MKNSALLLVSTEPPATLEEEFNDWYDTEHFPQRRSLPGFLSGSRWICLDGWPRYLALYELTSLDALASPEYRAVSDQNSTPWSQRILPRTIGRQRLVCVADGAPSDDLLHETRTTRLLLAGWPATDETQAAAVAAACRTRVAELPGASQYRVFRLHNAQPEIWLVVAFDRPVALQDVSALGHAAGLGATTFNLYAPYVRKRYAPSRI